MPCASKTLLSRCPPFYFDGYHHFDLSFGLFIILQVLTLPTKPFIQIRKIIRCFLREAWSSLIHHAKHRTHIGPQSIGCLHASKAALASE